MKNIHFSVDDFFDIFIDIQNGSYTDLFEQPVLQFFKEMHDTYGCKFSGHCFYTKDGITLDDINISDDLKKQIQDNSDWLKFGFHAWDYQADYGSTRFVHENVITDYDSAYDHCKRVIDSIKRICGGAINIDYIPRIHFFAGTRECCRAWKDLGMKGFLSADDDRISYYLSKEMNDKLLAENVIYDSESDLYFIKTNMRLEKTEDVVSGWNELVAKEVNCIEIFTHEKYLADPAILDKFRTIARLSKEDGYTFGFVQDVLGSI